MFPCKSSILRLFLVEDWLLEYFYVYMPLDVGKFVVW